MSYEFVNETWGNVRVGDTVKVWWAPRRDTVTAFEPYDGKLAHFWPAGVRIARFAILTGGMTVGNDEDVSVLRAMPQEVVTP